MSNDSGISRKSGGEAPAAEGVREATPESRSSTLGRYELKQRIGAGGMGWVYQAVDKQTGRVVALKVLPKSKAANPQLVKRFQSEAHAASVLNHESIVRVFDAGQADGYLYIALEYFEGSDVFQLVKEHGVLPLGRSIEIIDQMTQALEHAFEKGIVHRDIKPSNVLISRTGQAKLTDMGLARSIDESTDTGITRAGTTVGTVDYMAPEQARDSRSADIRSDIYSLGCTWYHMLTAEPPFPKGSVTNKLFAHMSSPRPDPRVLNKEITADVVEVMHTMMARKPKDRYQTPAELLDALDLIKKRARATSGRATPAPTPKPAEVSLRDTLADVDLGPTPSNVAVPLRTVRRAPARRNAVPKALTVTGIVVASLAILVALVWTGVSLFSGTERVDVIPLNGDPNDSDPADNQGDPGAATLANVDGQTTSPAKNRNASTDPKSSSQATSPGKGLPADFSPLDEPEWVDNWWSRDTLPDRVAEFNLERLTVGRDDGPPSEYGDLESAVMHLLQTGGLIELYGNGPFVLPATRIKPEKPLVIASAGNNQPVILLTLPGDPQASSCLSVAQSPLVLMGVHLTVVVDNYRAPRPRALVELTNADLIVRDSSVTMLGSTDAEITLFRINEQPAAAAGEDAEANQESTGKRVLLERSFFRGNGLIPLEVFASRIDLVARECLFAPGRAPLARVVDSSRSPARIANAPGRILRLLNSSATLRKSAFEFTQATAAQDAQATEPAATVLALRDSEIGVEQGVAPAGLIQLNDWPLTTGPRPMPRNVVVASRGGRFGGWQVYVGSNSGEFPAVTGANVWKQVWNEQPSHAQFSATPWPAFALGDPSQLDPRRLTSSDAQPGGSGASGCDATRLTIPDADRLDRARALAFSPRLPNSLTGSEVPTITVEVNLNNQDLGRVIAQTQWTGLAEFVVSGTDNRLSSPIRVNQRSLRIRGANAGAQTLQIAPKDVSTGGTDPADRAFIHVADGNLEIDGVQFSMLETMRQSPARWLISVTNGSFSIRDSQIRCPLDATPDFKGVIRWQGKKAGPIAPYPAGDYAHYGEIVECVLAGRTILQSDVQGQALSVSNSLLVGTDTLFLMPVAGPDANLAAAVDLRNATLAAGRRFFEIRSIPFREPPASPLRLFSDEAVFVPARTGVSGQSPRPELLACVTAGATQRHFEWWENRNGYSDALGAYLADLSASTTAKQADFDANWARVWGTNRGVMHPLWKSGDVRLGAANSTEWVLNPADYQLDAHCAASAWSTHGRPIGADVAKLGENVGRKGDADAAPEDTAAETEPAEVTEPATVKPANKAAADDKRNKTARPINRGPKKRRNRDD